MDKHARIYVAGHNGMVGAAITRYLSSQGYQNIITYTSDELDLRNQHLVKRMFEQDCPEYVFIAAAKVGGILANSNRPATFIYDNIAIQTNLIHQSYLSKVKKLLFLGSSCIYPKLAPQPLKEEYLLTGLLESSNEAYAIAKIAGIKMCEAYRTQHGCNFISVMPPNLYGPGDNYDLQTSHVLAALLRKIHEAKINQLPFVEIWGTGSASREFMHVDDLARACLFLISHYSDKAPINVGTGTDITIHNLAHLIKKVVGYEGNFTFDTSKPDGTPRKVMDITKITALGFTPHITLEEGIHAVYNEKFLKL